MTASSNKTRVLVSGTAFLFLSIFLALHPDVTLASAVSAAATSSDDCTDELSVCVSDEDCYTCLTAISNGDTSEYEECVSDVYQAGGADACSTLWNGYCCVDVLTEVDCMNNELVVGYYGCLLESVIDCSVEELSCGAGSISAIKDNSGAALGHSGIVYGVLLLGTLVVASLSGTG